MHNQAPHPFIYCALFVIGTSFMACNPEEEEHVESPTPAQQDMAMDSSQHTSPDQAHHTLDMSPDTQVDVQDMSPSGEDMRDMLDIEDMPSGEVQDVQVGDELFVTLPARARVAMTLHPHDQIEPGTATRVDVMIPFPRDVLFDGSLIQVRDSTNVEVASQSNTLLSWRSPTDGSVAQSVRAAKVSFTWTFDSREPVSVFFVYGLAPTLEFDLSQAPAASSHLITASSFFPNEYDTAPDISEPSVMATFSPKWLGASLLRTRTGGTSPGFSDEVLTSFAQSAVNDVRDHVTEGNKIPYQTAYEPWLFDRAGTLWNVYILTGEIKWLRHAMRASQFYKQQVEATGYFALKASNDLKYSYTLSMFIAHVLTGDDTYPDVIRTVANTVEADGFNPLYESRFNFWTERHLAYKLQSSLILWELTGTQAHLDAVNQIIAHNLQQTRTPPEGWAPVGCILHTVSQHEGASNAEPICSPWMTSLYADILWRVYIVTGSTDALEQLSEFGDYVRTHGTYVDEGVTLPHYLSGPQYDSLAAGVSSVSSDREHACDVAGLAYRAAYAQQLLNKDATNTRATADELLDSCLGVLSGWIRTSQATVDAGKTFYRLAPPRKFNWWFGTTSDVAWLAR